MYTKQKNHNQSNQVLFHLFFITGVQTCALTNNYIDNTSNRAYAAGGLTAFTFYFDEFVESCRLGIRKPDPNIFHEALARLGAEASQV